MSDERHDCGHTDADHEEYHELSHLVEHLVQHAAHSVRNPRVALVIADDGEIHFATSLHPGEAANMVQQMVDRIRRYGGNYVHDHFDRGSAAEWN